MRTAILPLAFVPLMLIVGCQPKLYGPKGLSKAVYEAAHRAIDTFDRLNEYRDSGILLYEPRYLDAERAASEVRDAEGDQPSDFLIGLKLRTCLIIFKRYRLDIQRIQNLGELNSVAPKDQNSAISELRSAGRDIDTCLKEAGDYL